MKKLLIGLMVGLMGVAFAGIEETDGFKKDWKNATDLLITAKEYARAQAAFEKVLVDYPVLSMSYKSTAFRQIGAALVGQKKYAEAQAAYEQGLKEIPANYKFQRTFLFYGLADSLRFAGKSADASKSYMDCVREGAWDVGAGTNTAGVLWLAFNHIDPASVPDAEYKQFLTDIIKSTKATEDNAKFLGRLKSELEKSK